MNPILKTDSYKVSHWRMLPPGTTNTYCYLEARNGGKLDKIIYFGLLAMLKEHFSTPVTMADVRQAKAIVDAHMGPGIFNEEGWLTIVNEFDGWLPIKIYTLPEGKIYEAGTPLLAVENTDPRFAWLPSYLEPIFEHLWYPTTVATVSNNVRQILLEGLRVSGTESAIDFKLHDFGLRGVSSFDSARIGGMAHLTNFKGTDNLPALLAAKEYYGVEMAGFSIPACYDDKTEILTEDGFVHFADLKADKMVAQYYPNVTIEFVKHTEVKSSHYSGRMIEFSSKGDAGKIDIVVTPNHRMIRRSIATYHIEVSEAENAKFSHRNVLIQAGRAIGKIDHLTDWDRLRIAFQADGSFVNRHESYNGD